MVLPIWRHANVLYIEFSVQLRVLLWPAISAKTATFAILNFALLAVFAVCAPCF